MSDKPSGFDYCQRRQDRTSSYCTKNDPHQYLPNYLSGQPSFSWRLISHISLNGRAISSCSLDEFGINTKESEIADVVR
jgi:hypothetical protein